MVVLGSGRFRMSEVPLPDRAVEPEQWLQRHPEAGSSWTSWPKASQVWTRRASGGLLTF